MRTVHKTKMGLERETKGAALYGEIDESGAKVDFKGANIGSLYLRKSALGGSIPRYIIVTVETD